jgi:hypothetical protein
MPEQSQHNRPGEIDRREALKILASAAAGAVMPNPAVGMPAPLAVLTSQQKASGAAALLGEVLKLAQAIDNWHRQPLRLMQLPGSAIPRDAETIDLNDPKTREQLERSYEKIVRRSKLSESDHLIREDALRQVLNARDKLFRSPEMTILVSELKKGCLETNNRCLRVITEEFDSLSKLPNVASEEELLRIREEISRLECHEDRVMFYEDPWFKVIDSIEKIQLQADKKLNKSRDELSDSLYRLCDRGRREIQTGIFESLGLSEKSADRLDCEVPDAIQNSLDRGPKPDSSSGRLFDLFFSEEKFFYEEGYEEANLFNLDPKRCLGDLSRFKKEEDLIIRHALEAGQKLGLDHSARIDQETQRTDRHDNHSESEAYAPQSKRVPDEPEIKKKGDGYLLVSDQKFVLEEMSCARLLKLASYSFELTGQTEAIAAKEVVDVTRCDDQADVTYKVQFPEPADNSRDVLVAIRMMSQGFGDVSFHVPESKKPQVISMLQGEALFVLIKNSDPKVVSLKAGSFAECIFHVELFGVGGAGV